MATVYVIHDPADRPFVESTLLPPLPSLGFDRWISSDSPTASEQALARCKAALVVVSKAAQRSETVRRDASRCLKSIQTLVPVQIDDTSPDLVAAGLEALPRVDRDDEIIRALPGLLPPLEDKDDSWITEAALPISWNEQIFSQYLIEVITRNDFNRGEALMKNLERHLRLRPSPYGVRDAKNDLRALRRKRQFRLMGQYANLVLASGTKDLQIQRQLAQSLIERGQLDDAVPVLEAIIESAKPDDPEQVEALGLLGRVFKQKYVNAPKDRSASDWLRRSVDYYIGVYRNRPDNFWHGVNAASLLLRAHRDHLTWADPAEARKIAEQILARWEELRAQNKLHVWDFATRVEALIALEKFKDAEQALDAYLTHPEMGGGSEDWAVFEIASTFRQFDEVLQLGEVAAGHGIYDTLLRAADRFRANGVTSTPPQRENTSESDPFPIMIRVSDPTWSHNVTGLRIGSQLGTVITARATRDAIRTLLKDPVVVSIEESRSVIDVRRHECAHSLPFISVAEDGCYRDGAGPFQERGTRALIAVIDDGIDVLHQAFTDPNGQSRVVAIWDQSDDDVDVLRPEGFEYGRYHSSKDIQQYVATHQVPKRLGRNPDGHGTHVTSIAAGRAVGTFYGGLAPEAQIIVVITKDDGEIGYSNAHLDALTFIDMIATDLKKPVVVNVSKGMNAGSHDGKSSLEAGFDEFTKSGTRPGRVVVKSAGNERNTRGHAVVPVAVGDAQLTWVRQPQDWKFERIELWWSSADTLTFKLRSPGGDWSAVVGLASPDVSETLQEGGPIHLQLNPRDPVSGDSQLRIEIGNGQAPIQQGKWVLHIKVAEAKSGEPLHAWIGRGGGVASEFTSGISEEVTLTVPGTASSVITVGAIEIDPPMVGESSSHGPTRDGRRKPEVVAPGIGVRAACGGTATETRLDSGTSMAAPHVSGAIALVLSRNVQLKRELTANQIRMALMQKTKHYNGHFSPGQGFGIVDVAAFLMAF